jgi:hypothetical protein
MAEEHALQLPREPPHARHRLPRRSKAKLHDVDGEEPSPRRSASSNKNSKPTMSLSLTCALTLTPISKHFQGRPP